MDQLTARRGQSDSTSAEELSLGMRPTVSLESWFFPDPDRRILIVDRREEPEAGHIDQLLRQLERYDAVAAATELPAAYKSLPRKQRTIQTWSGGLDVLPFKAGQFDLVISAYISAGSDVEKETFLEFGRVLSASGHLLIIDYLVPGSRLRGKKARKIRAAGEYINTWMRLRNPCHRDYLDQDSWRERLAGGRWHIEQMSTREILLDLDTWIDGFPHDAKDRLRLQAMLVQAPEKVHSFLTPHRSGDRIAFRMTAVFILATKQTA